MNTQNTILDILIKSNFIDETFESWDKDPYYLPQKACGLDSAQRILDCYEFEGEVEFMIIPLSTAKNFFKNLNQFEGFNDTKKLNNDDLIMISLSDNYIFNLDDLNHYNNELIKFIDENTILY